jgi:beta-galactosidase
LSNNGSDWQDVLVPSSIDEVGRFIFRRTVDIPEDLLGDHVFKLVALGMNHDAEIFVNDIYIGRHIGGYTSFSIEIPADVLQSGPENAIEVVVHNDISAKATIPVRQQSWGWRTYGDILRDLSLIAYPNLWIDELRPVITYNAEARTGSISLETVLSGGRKDADDADSIRIPDPGESYLFEVELVDMQTGATIAVSPPQIFIPEPNKSVELRTTLGVPRAKVWRPGRPELYLLRAAIISQEGRRRTIVDVTTRTVGFADVAIRDGRMYERGALLHLRGVVWHEESTPSGGSLSYEQMERDMAMIKSLGANAVRFAFHPPHPYLLDLCSRYGLYALVEIPVWNVPSPVLDQEAFRNLAINAATEMVEQLAHHPSILGWGVGGCIDGSDEQAATYVTSLAEAVSGLDPRPVYAGIGAEEEDRTAASLEIAALLLRSGDVKEFRSTLASLKKMYPDRPAIVLSYGPQVEEENRNGYRDPGSQEAQARYFLQHIAAIKESGFSGGFVEAFSDWKGDRPVLTIRGEDRTLHPLGLVNMQREKRLAYDVVRSQYQEEKFSAIPAGSFKPQFPAAQVVVGLLLIIVFGYQYSYNRRFGEAVKRALLRSYNFFADLRDRDDVPALATFILSLCLAITLGVVYTSILHHFRFDSTADAIMTLLLPWDILKSEMILASWDPVRGIAVFSGIAYFLLLLFTGLIKVVSMIARVRLTVSKAWNITIWGSLPLMVLSPVGMSLFKIMETSAFILPSMVLILFVNLWALMRIVKGASVVLDMSTVKTYGITFIVCIVMAGSLFLLAENQMAFTAYLDHLHVAIGSAP